MQAWKMSEPRFDGVSLHLRSTQREAKLSHAYDDAHQDMRDVRDARCRFARAK